MPHEFDLMLADPGVAALLEGGPLSFGVDFDFGLDRLFASDMPFLLSAPAEILAPDFLVLTRGGPFEEGLFRIESGGTRDFPAVFAPGEVEALQTQLAPFNLGADTTSFNRLLDDLRVDTTTNQVTDPRGTVLGSVQDFLETPLGKRLGITAGILGLGAAGVGIARLFTGGAEQPQLPPSPGPTAATAAGQGALERALVGAGGFAPGVSLLTPGAGESGALSLERLVRTALAGQANLADLLGGQIGRETLAELQGAPREEAVRARAFEQLLGRAPELLMLPGVRESLLGQPALAGGAGKADLLSAQEGGPRESLPGFHPDSFGVPPDLMALVNQGLTWEQAASRLGYVLDPTTNTFIRPGVSPAVGGAPAAKQDFRPEGLEGTPLPFVAGVGGYSGIPPGYTGLGRDQRGRVVQIRNGEPQYQADLPVQQLVPQPGGRMATLIRPGVPGLLEGEPRLPALDRLRAGLETRAQRVLEGGFASPALERRLADEERVLRASLQAQLGPGYELSTPGIETLAEFRDRAHALRQAEERQELATLLPLEAGRREFELGFPTQEQARREGIRRNRLSDVVSLSRFGRTPAIQTGTALGSLVPATSLLGLGSAEEERRFQRGLNAQLTLESFGSREAERRQLASQIGQIFGLAGGIGLGGSLV